MSTKNDDKKWAVLENLLVRPDFYKEVPPGVKSLFAISIHCSGCEEFISWQLAQWHRCVRFLQVHYLLTKQRTLMLIVLLLSYKKLSEIQPIFLFFFNKKILSLKVFRENSDTIFMSTSSVLLNLSWNMSNVWHKLSCLRRPKFLFSFYFGGGQNIEKFFAIFARAFWKNDTWPKMSQEIHTITLIHMLLYQPMPCRSKNWYLWCLRKMV